MINAIYNKNHPKDKDIDLYFHNGGESIKDSFLLFGMVCDKLNSRIAFIEYPGENGLISPFTKENVNKMAEKVIGDLGKKGYVITNCIGFGIGTGIAAEVAYKHKIPGLMLIGPYSDFTVLINYQLRLKNKYLKNLFGEVISKNFDFNTEKIIEDYGGDLRIYSGENDTFTPFSHSERLVHVHIKFNRYLYSSLDSDSFFDSHNKIMFYFLNENFVEEKTTPKQA